MNSSPLPRLKQGLDDVLAWAVALAMIGAVLLVLWQVLGRYVLDSPSSFTDEAVRYLLVWIGLLGGAQAAGRRLHLAIDLLPERLEPSSRHRLAAFNQTLIGLFALAVLCVGGGSLVSLTFELGQRSAALGVPLGFIYLVLPLSGLLITFYAVLFAWDHLRQARGETSFLAQESVEEAA